MTSRSGKPGLVSSVMNAFGVGSQSKTGTGGKGLGKTKLANCYMILRQAISILESRERKTVTVSDVVFVLRRLGTPVYGFGLPER
ncbi:hypothetical protein B0A49_02369 [Cryomyces minteri]|uniref:Histone H4 n=1 Tax=Cryomyces minteri TaxID=331657 RepID=A0A4U0XNK9_9PEZI|nr:hypothetical protein B0A49_02369 [Cryomyces minteri]